MGVRSTTGSLATLSEIHLDTCSFRAFSRLQYSAEYSVDFPLAAKLFVESDVGDLAAAFFEAFGEEVSLLPPNLNPVGWALLEAPPDALPNVNPEDVVPLVDPLPNLKPEVGALDLEPPKEKPEEDTLPPVLAAAVVVVPPDEEEFEPGLGVEQHTQSVLSASLATMQTLYTINKILDGLNLMIP